MADGSVHARLVNVMADVQSVGKTDRNAQQGFSFRGIDAVLNAVGPALRKHGVFVTPEVVQFDREPVEVGKNRTPMLHVALVVKYTFHGEQGDSVSATVPAEAMDSGDKATAKAMSVALRTALLQVLALPTDEPDPDSHSYERSAPKGLSADVEALLVSELGAVKTNDELAIVQARLSEVSSDMTSEQRTLLLGKYSEAKGRLGA